MSVWSCLDDDDDDISRWDRLDKGLPGWCRPRWRFSKEERSMLSRAVEKEAQQGMSFVKRKAQGGKEVFGRSQLSIDMWTMAGRRELYFYRVS